MFGLIKRNENKIILLLLFLLVVLTCCLYFKRLLCQDKVKETAQMQSYKEKCNCERLLVNTYLKGIQQSSDDFYDEYYTIIPTVDSYSVTIKEFVSDNSNSQVTFTSKPFVGPHDSIGIDEITFSADYIGNVKLEKFEHIISYNLPDNLKNLEKKRIPGKYE